MTPPCEVCNGSEMPGGVSGYPCPGCSPAVVAAPSFTIDHAEAVTWLRAREDGSADAVVTDPPYCSGGFTEAQKAGATHQGLRSETVREGRVEWFGGDNMTTGGLVWLLRAVAVEAERILTPEGSLCVFCDWRMAVMLAPALESAGLRLRNLVVWDKESIGCGSGFRPQHELFLHLTKRAPKFHDLSVGNVIRSKRVPPKKRTHAAEKPVDMLERVVRVVAPAGGLVLDPFGGSFAVGEAALASGRRFSGCDKDARYVAAGRRRLAEVKGVPIAAAELFAGMEL